MIDVLHALNDETTRVLWGAGMLLFIALVIVFVAVWPRR